ncbi:reductase [Lithospermum erythrorhizon]|uniref:ascorbate ferrireductase (transmembrane) n=1 Tax=Lithospermum erythrorhizon TaxID=34254 RepID=A0AAV3RKD9_LITER
MAGKVRAEVQVSAGPVIMFAHLLAIVLTILVFVWVFHFREGLAFRSKNKFKIFNIHPLLMVVGFVLMVGEALMAYKTVPAVKQRQKFVHMLLNLIALITGILGIYAVFKYHIEADIPDLYSLHSWIGISTICLFVIQWLLAFFTFMYPKAEHSKRARFAPWHVLFGILIFFMAIISAITGLVEKFIFLNLGRSQEGLVVNFTGLLLLLFGVSVLLTLLFHKY